MHTFNHLVKQMYIECHLCARHCSREWEHDKKQDKQKTCSHGACIQMKGNRYTKKHNIMSDGDVCYAKN